MADLYIIGAGASKNYTQSDHGIRGLVSPVDRDFFKMARRVLRNTARRADPIFLEDIEALMRSVDPSVSADRDNFRIFNRRGFSLEAVMTQLDIDFRLFSQATPAASGQGESRESRALKDLLAITLEYALRGPVCDKHTALARGMKKGDIVISFNYDILMDNALFHERKITDSGYLMNFFMTNEYGVWNRPIDAPSDVTLLKLHGSLNWVKCGFCGVLLLYRHKKQTIPGTAGFQCPRCSSDRSMAQRLMIPPIQSKNYGDRDMAFLWVQADQLMRDFSRIVCIGYSFSPLDFDMLTLMKRFRTRRTSAPLVDFVSPDRKARKRLKAQLGVEEVRTFDNLPAYLKESRQEKG